MSRWIRNGELTEEGRLLLSTEGMSAEEISEIFPHDKPSSIRVQRTRISKQVETLPVAEEEDPKPVVKPRAKSLEYRYDGQVVINWADRTILTDLGKEFGTMTLSFDLHNALQRAYSDMYEDKGENQEELAMRFDFHNARAVSRYLKIHGIRHSSLPQSDLEFEEGLDEDSAVEETVRSIRRRVHAKTRKAIWADTQKDADNWRRFEESVLTPLREDIRANLPKYRPEKVNLALPNSPYIAVIGLSDLHFAKYAYNPSGEQTYGIRQSLEAMKQSVGSLLGRLATRGAPSRILVTVGSDNFHVDNEMKTTTRGTPQDIEGEYEILLRPYIEANIWLVEQCRQIAPVDVMVVKGNHDKTASMWIGHLLHFRYEDSDDVNVVQRTHPRTYVQFGRYCLGFTHGDPEFTSTTKTDRNIHKLFLIEAKQQEVNIQNIDHYYMFAGNLHYEHSRDYGQATYLQMPALCGDDRWHKENVYVGARKQTAAYVVDATSGLIEVLYAPVGEL